MAEDGQKTYSAKQVATRIGTEAKLLRKFFRDENSGYKPVGQGGRYDFPESDIPKIKAAFDAWNSTKTRRNRPTSAERQLASQSSLIPGQRKDSPTPTSAPKRNMKAGLHGNALDEDTLHDRMKGIKARVQQHGLQVRQGRLVPGDSRIAEAKEILNPFPPKESIPGLTKTTPEPRILDFSEEDDRDPTDAEIDALVLEDSDDTVLDLDDSTDDELDFEEE